MLHLEPLPDTRGPLTGLSHDLLLIDGEELTVLHDSLTADDCSVDGSAGHAEDHMPWKAATVEGGWDIVVDKDEICERSWLENADLLLEGLRDEFGVAVEENLAGLVAEDTWVLVVELLSEVEELHLLEHIVGDAISTKGEWDAALDDLLDAWKADSIVHVGSWVGDDSCAGFLDEVELVIVNEDAVAVDGGWAADSELGEAVDDALAVVLQ